MKRALLLISFICFYFSSIYAQSKLTFNEYFDYSNGYCPGDSQYDNWVSLITSLDTSTDKYTKITLRGTYDMVGKSCTDKYAVRQIADALSNGYDVSVACDGEVWSVGTGCSDYNCGNTADYIELTLNTYTCNCGTSYTIRPGITSPNWGGINTETCQWWTQNANQRMICEIERIYGNDNLSLKSFTLPDQCEYTQALEATVSNMGLNTVNSYYVGYSINGNLQTPVYVTNAIASDAFANIQLASSYSFTANTSYVFKVWTYSPNGNSDSETSNDTLVFNYFHTGSPAKPTASNVIQCGVGKAEISANSSDSILWYDDMNAGKAVAFGSNFVTPYLYSTDTFYAESRRFKGVSEQFGTGFYNYTSVSYDQYEYNGGMLDISANELLKISGITVQSVFGNTTPHYKVYIREGGFTGYETDSTAWTRVFDGQLSNGGVKNTIPVSIVLEPGIDYGLYVTTDPANGEDIWVNYAVNSYSNADLNITGGNCVYGKFGSIGVYTPWTLDCQFEYEKTCASASRQAVVVTVNPKPYGSELQAGPNFDGKYKLGFLNDPDISEVGHSLSYELTPPASYSNTGYGTAWKVNSVDLVTEGGSTVSSGLYTFNPPSGNDNATLVFTSDTNLLDSNVIIKFSISDLGPYFCDTLLTRVVHIAPTPKPNFKVPSTICVGDDVYFTNLSTIHSGSMTYKWYFTSTDSTDFVEPVYNFNTPGSYQVRLVATSDPYGIEADTVITIVVGQIPSVNFKVNNACEGNSVSFVNLTPGSNVNFTWDFGDMTPKSFVKNPSHNYPRPDRYIVNLKGDLNGCTASLSKNAYLFPTPVAQFDDPGSELCMFDSFQLTNTSTISSGRVGSLWTFNDGNKATVTNPKHVYKTMGTYQIQLKMVSEFGCADTASRQMIVKPAPTVDFSIGMLCENESTNFTNLSTEFSGVNSTYQWTFSDAQTLNTKDASRSWSNYGPYTATLKSMLSNGCEGELTKEFVVLKQAKAAFEVQDVCDGDLAIFVNKTILDNGDPQFKWYFGDNSPVTTERHPQHLYSIMSTTTYTVALVVSVEGGCDDTAFRQLDVTLIPNCDFSVAPHNVIGFNHYKFTPANATYDKYEWLFGEGGTSMDVSPVYQYQILGNFDVTLKATENNCNCVKTKRVSITQTGLANELPPSIKVYPNPADDQLSIEMGQEGTFKVRMYNVVGQLVSEQVFMESGELDTQNLVPGLYTLELEIDGKTYVLKISVNH